MCWNDTVVAEESSISFVLGKLHLHVVIHKLYDTKGQSAFQPVFAKLDATAAVILSHD